MQIRDRIREFKRVSPSLIRPNARNWRVHPDKQRNALKGSLADVGIVDALLCTEQPDGSYRLVDGHLRAEEITQQDVPILVLDIDEREEAEVLATFDPIGELAETNHELLGSLCNDFNSTSAAIQELLASKLHIPGLDGDDGDGEGAGGAPDQSDRANVGFVVLIDCEDETHQLDTIGFLQEHGYKCRALT